MIVERSDTAIIDRSARLARRSFPTWSPVTVDGFSGGPPARGQNGAVRSTGGELIGGDVAEGFGGVADAFGANFRDRGELGAAVAVFRHGQKVVDLWGGVRDRGRGLVWEADTLVPVFSTTKGMTATAMAVAHARGRFGLDEPVSS